MHTSSLFSGKQIARNAVINLLGQILPALFALVSIPPLIHRLGTERFGVLMLAWMCLGYFNIFDFGLSRALTRSVASSLGEESQKSIPALFWTTIVTTAVLGVFGALAMISCSHLLVSSVFKVPASLEGETQTALNIIAVCIPFVITSIGFRGYLEAIQEFGIINRVQVPIGASFYVTPLLFSFASISLPVVISALVLTRLAAWLFLFRAALKTPYLATHPTDVRFEMLPELLKFGGWITFSNMLIPIIGYADRFLIGILVSLSAVTYYSTPYEIVNRTWVIPVSLMSVVFPAMASDLLLAPARVAELYAQATKILFALFAPLTLFVLFFSYDILHMWAGNDIATHSSEVMQVLMIAMLINTFGLAPSALLDALGKPAITAISHLLQLPIYLGALYLVVPKIGLKGAAIIWVVRNLVDSVTLVLFAKRSFPQLRVDWLRVLRLTMIFAPSFALAGWFPLNLWVRLALFIFMSIGFGVWTWYGLFSFEERRKFLLQIFDAFRVLPSNLKPPRAVRETVGIAMAVYNPDLNFLESQLESIRLQDYPKWVCVVSCDSEIPAAAVLDRYKTDSRFVWIRNNRQPGVKGNFENAILAVLQREVDVIAFSDQDDVWYPSKIGVGLREINKSEGLALVHSNMHLFSNDSELVSPNSDLPTSWEKEVRFVHDYTPFHFLSRNIVTGAASMFDAEIARIGLPIPADADLHDHWYAVVASVVGEVRPIHESLYAYRQHNDNVIGFIKYEGLFYKPDGVSWGQGLLRSKKSWARSLGLFSYLESTGLSGRLPKLYGQIFRSRFFGPLVFLGSSFAYLFNDPLLARAFLFKGIGGVLSFTYRKREKWATEEVH